MKKYNEFSIYYQDSAWFQDYLDDKIEEADAIRSAAREFQFQVDGFSNEKIVEKIIENYYN